MIQLKHLYKKFGQRLAVDDLTLQVPAGEIYGLLGHNGAGKSTAIGMMLGQVWPTSGDVRICGHDVTAHRRLALQKVGAIFESPAFYDYLSGRRNLEILSSYTAPTSAPANPGGHRMGRPDRAGTFQGADLLARHEGAAGAGPGAVAPAGAAHPRRAERWARPRGHPRDAADDSAAASRAAADDSAFVPFPQRGGTALHAHRRAEPGPHGV